MQKSLANKILSYFNTRSNRSRKLFKMNKKRFEVSAARIKALSQAKLEI